MGKIGFNVDAYTARLIGRENVSDLRGALFELVKNTYDADASVCFLYYSGKSLYIGDNGIGMEEKVIVDNWMTIGRSTKKKQFISGKGRIQTGAKGIGRFALDRLGDKCEMFTINSQDKLLWTVDWGDFDKNSIITDIKADLSVTSHTFTSFISEDNKNEDLINLVLEKFGGRGTVFKISDLRDDWQDEKTLEKQKKQLRSLVPPSLSHNFKIYFFNQNDNVEQSLLNGEGEGDYDYSVRFRVQNSDRVNIEIHRNEFYFGDRFEEIMTDAGFSNNDREFFLGKPMEFTMNFSDVFKTRDQIINEIGDFEGRLYFSKIQSNKKDEEKYFYKNVTGRQKIEPAFAGIKLYRDNFRVRPYGEYDSSNFDWLLISSRKQKSPAAISHKSGKWRVSSEQIYGSVFISRLNIKLPDQSNREGIIETTEFKMFKNFILEIISYFENDRQYVFRKLNAYYEKINEAERIQYEIEKKAKKEKEENKKAPQGFNNEVKIVDGAENKKTIDKFETKVSASDAQKVIEHKDILIKSLEDENKMLRALATTGIVTNTYIHEIKGITHSLNLNVITAYEDLSVDNDIQSALESLDTAISSKESLNSWFEVTLDSIKKDKRTWRKINISMLLKSIVGRWNDILKSKSIDINYKHEDDNIMLYCHSFEIESIINNLIANSYSAFSTPIKRAKVIDISLYMDKDSLVINYIDSGPGLPAGSKNNPDVILEPFVSEKRDDDGGLAGTGMGMWIIDKTVRDYKGTIDLSENKINQHGFFFKLILPRGGRK